MSHTNFAHWGKRSAENIQRLIAGTDYGSSYTNANELLQDGQLVVDITIPQYMAWINNTSTDGSGNFYEGCFMGPEYSQYFSSSTNFANFMRIAAKPLYSPLTTATATSGRK